MAAAGQERKAAGDAVALKAAKEKLDQAVDEAIKHTEDSVENNVFSAANKNDQAYVIAGCSHCYAYGTLAKVAKCPECGTKFDKDEKAGEIVRVLGIEQAVPAILQLRDAAANVVKLQDAEIQRQNTELAQLRAALAESKAALEKQRAEFKAQLEKVKLPSLPPANQPQAPAFFDKKDSQPPKPPVPIVEYKFGDGVLQLLQQELEQGKVPPNSLYTWEEKNLGTITDAPIWLVLLSPLSPEHYHSLDQLLRSPEIKLPELIDCKQGKQQNFVPLLIYLVKVGGDKYIKNQQSMLQTIIERMRQSGELGKHLRAEDVVSGDTLLHVVAEMVSKNFALADHAQAAINILKMVLSECEKDKNLGALNVQNLKRQSPLAVYQGACNKGNTKPIKEIEDLLKPREPAAKLQARRG